MTELTAAPGNDVVSPLGQSRKRKRATAGDNVGDLSASQGSDATNIDPPGGSTGPSGSSGSVGTPVGAAPAYNPKIKNPRHHYDAAVACMARRAALTGHTAALVRRLCMADRGACDSLAAYQHLLTDTRRRLARLGADPGDSFAVWVALGGLRTAHSRWHGKLVALLAAGHLDWDGLMAAMAGRACRE